MGSQDSQLLRVAQYCLDSETIAAQRKNRLRNGYTLRYPGVRSPSTI